MKTLNVIGAGRVGRTLGALWEEKRTFSVQDVLDRTLGGARAAAAFIGNGTAVESLAAARPADVWMLTTPDRHIAQWAEQLAVSGLLRSGDIVFHFSGSLSSGELAAAAALGAHAA